MNSELANDLGNLAQRSLSHDQQELRRARCRCPALSPKRIGPCWTPRGALLGQVRGASTASCSTKALEAILAVVRAANGYIDSQAPWALQQDRSARMSTVLYVLAETVRHIALLLQPVHAGIDGASCSTSWRCRSRARFRLVRRSAARQARIYRRRRACSPASSRRRKGRRSRSDRPSATQARIGPWPTYACTCGARRSTISPMPISARQRVRSGRM